MENSSLAEKMNTVYVDRRSLSLLISLLLFFVSATSLEGHPIGDRILIFSLFILLVASIVGLSAKRAPMRFCVPLVIVSIVFLLVAQFHPTRVVHIINFSLLIFSFGLCPI